MFPVSYAEHHVEFFKCEILNDERMNSEITEAIAHLGLW